MDADDLSLDDNRTIQAIGILADVLDGVEGPGGLDTVLVSKALRQVIATKSQPAFEFASRAFNTLDPAVRRQVADHADEAAHHSVELRGRVGGFLSTAPKKPVPQGPVVGQQPNFITALNLRSRRRPNSPS
ncbi:hypothetical protein VY88_32060 [Azospirillum thiophilum]|uniref:Uncharacterized protein n=1 Tax=Azospirillum thiophilum TaxID=528244 RepID=A0AAC8VZN1_9PROT|nr:hypothetical protein [Azospirillum thiophilum]ALG72378.1 hypothetical protein AL072_14775 [Azospirillum thiophilum]KJR61341.1 hypothetical protein VY88_32060 [Azospirillum thiophilum]